MTAETLAQIATPIGALVLLLWLVFRRMDKQEDRQVERDKGRDTEHSEREQRMGSRINALEDRMHSTLEKLVDRQGEIILANTTALVENSSTIRDFARAVEACQKGRA